MRSRYKDQKFGGSATGLPEYLCRKASLRPKNSAWPSAKPTLPRASSFLLSLAYLLEAFLTLFSCREATRSHTWPVSIFVESGENEPSFTVFSSSQTINTFSPGFLIDVMRPLNLVLPKRTPPPDTGLVNRRFIE